MSQDKHYNATDENLPQALNDRKGTDMPAARTIMVVIVSMLGVFAIVAAIMYARTEPASAPPSDVQQEQPPGTHP